MKRSAKPDPARKQQAGPPQPLPDPVDVVDGIPDRSTRSGKWVLVLLGAVFLAWVAFLVYNAVAGGIEQ